MSGAGIYVGRVLGRYSVVAVDTRHGSLTFGAEEIAPDGSRRVLCECDHDSKEAAVECSIPRCVPELARAAFEAYGASTGGKTYDGRDIPPFDVIRQNTPHVAAAWEAAAEAVRKLVKP